MDKHRHSGDFLKFRARAFGKKNQSEQIKLVRCETMFCQAKLQAPSTTACLCRYIRDGTWASNSKMEKQLRRQKDQSRIGPQSRAGSLSSPNLNSFLNSQSHRRPTKGLYHTTEIPWCYVQPKIHTKYASVCATVFKELLWESHKNHKSTKRCFWVHMWVSSHHPTHESPQQGNFVQSAHMHWTLLRRRYKASSCRKN